MCSVCALVLFPDDAFLCRGRCVLGLPAFADLYRSMMLRDDVVSLGESVCAIPDCTLLNGKANHHLIGVLERRSTAQWFLRFMLYLQSIRTISLNSLDTFKWPTKLIVTKRQTGATKLDKVFMSVVLAQRFLN